MGVTLSIRRSINLVINLHRNFIYIYLKVKKKWESIESKIFGNDKDVEIL